MIVVQGAARVPVHDVERLSAALAWFVPACREDDGCILYAVAQDMFEPGLIHVSSRWESEAAYAAHAASPHVARLYEVLAKIDVTDFHVTSYDAANENAVVGG